MSFPVPVKDMLFAMEHLANLDQVAQIPGFEDANLETAQAVLEECAKFDEGVIEPLNIVGDKHPSSLNDGVVTTTAGFKEAFAQFAEGGWQGLQHPVDFGGQGLPKTIGAALPGNAQQRQPELCPVPLADRWRHRGLADRGKRRTQGHLPAKDWSPASGRAR